MDVNFINVLFVSIKIILWLFSVLSYNELYWLIFKYWTSLTFLMHTYTWSHAHTLTQMKKLGPNTVSFLCIAGFNFINKFGLWQGEGFMPCRGANRHQARAAWQPEQRTLSCAASWLTCLIQLMAVSTWSDRCCELGLLGGELVRAWAAEHALWHFLPPYLFRKCLTPFRVTAFACIF